MDSRDIECFETLYRTRSMVAAADELAISRATLSCAVARLEMELAVHLFVRDKRGCAPTAAGHAFHEQTRRFAVEWRASVEELRNIDRGIGRTLRFGCNIAYLTGDVSSAISLFCASHPDVWVSTEHSPDYERLWSSLVAGELDVVLSGELPKGLDLPHTTIGSGIVCLCMAPTHPLATCEALAFPDDLWGESIVTCLPAGRSILEPHGISPACTVPNLTAVIDLVASGRYVSLAPDQYLAGYIARGCACVPFGSFPEALRSCLVTHTANDPLLKEFTELVRTSMEAAASCNRQLLGLEPRG